MTPNILRASTLLLILLAVVPARAQDVVHELSQRIGQKIDLNADPALKRELVNATIVRADATELTVTADVLREAFAAQRFRNQVDATRYHVGERILVEQSGKDSRYTPRAEIVAINPDGTYQVKVWDKVESVTQPSVTDHGYVHLWTGKALPGEDMTTVKIKNPDGTVETKDVKDPWLLRENERTITLTHDQIDALNGKVGLEGAFTLNGNHVDLANDWVLKQRVEQANELADKMFKPGTLQLPADAEGRKKKLEQISKLQEKFLNEIFKLNYMEHPGNESDGKDPGFDQEFPRWAGRASDRYRKVLQDHPELSGKVGALLEAGYGVCTEQAAAIAAVVEGVASRVGLTIRPMQGRTIGESAMHGIDIIRFANGKLGMYDVTWHFIDEADAVKAVDNLDFATYDTRPDSNRNIDVIAQPTTKKTDFVDRTAPKSLDLSRGYTRDQAESYFVAATHEHANTRNISFDQAAAEVLAGNTKFERVGGDFTATVIAARARGIAGPSGTPGFLSGLDKTSKLVSDRVRDAVDPAHVDGR